MTITQQLVVGPYHDYEDWSIILTIESARSTK